MSFRCFLPAWIAAWAVAVFVPSALIAWLGLSPSVAAIGTGFDRFFATTWQVADDVGPVVKLVIGGLLFLCFLGLQRSTIPSPGRRLAAGAAIGMAVMIATITLVPPDLSRGFAAALTGARFDGATLPLYLLGGALAGAVFVLSIDRCRARR